MRTIAAVFSLMILVAAGLCQAAASEAETIDAINKAAAALDAAFAQKDVEAIKGMMTPDHVSVTPYYDGPQSVADQVASLPELDFGQAIQGKVTVTLLGPDAAMRTFTAALNGSFKGKPLPALVFATEILVKRDGMWVEQFYQVTTLKPYGRRAFSGERGGEYGKP